MKKIMALTLATLLAILSLAPAVQATEAPQETKITIRYYDDGKIDETGVTVAQNEPTAVTAAREMFLDDFQSGLIDAQAELNWGVRSTAADGKSAEAIAQILTLHGEERVIEQTTKWSAEDERWETSYREGEWGTTPATFLGSIDPKK